MSKITLNNGDQKITLKKSSKYVGLKSKQAVTETNDVEKEVLSNLGGFSIVTLENGQKSIDEKLDEVRKDENVEVGTHVYYVPGNSKRPLVPTGEIYLTFAAGVSVEEQEVVIDEFNLELVERRTDTECIVKVTPDSPNPLKVAKVLQNLSLIELAIPDLDALLEEYELEIDPLLPLSTPFEEEGILEEFNFIEPRDNLYQHQWQLKNTGSIVDVNWRTKLGADAKVVDAWKKLGNTGSEEIVVAIVDNGFDIFHPDLSARIYKPWDFWNNSSRLEMNDPRFTHGTPCASVAIARINGQGIVGAAPSAKFMPLSGTSFSLRATEQIFDYCIENGADVISCSWGTTDPSFDLNPMKRAAIAKAAKKGRNGKGCVILFAVGNDGLDYVSYYAQHPDVIAVAASTSKDQYADYSNRGDEVTICAPSNGDWPITAARASWDEGVSWETGNYRYWRDGRSRGVNYKHFGGTSSACPLAAGICALILSANPDLTAKQVKNILKSTADKIGSSSEYRNGHSTRFGFGRINAGKAVEAALRLKEKDNDPDIDKPSNPDSGVVIPPVSSSKGRGIFRFSVKKQAPVGYGVQIGAFAEYGNVLIQAEKLESQFGEPVVVSINELRGKTIYKVVVGAFSSRISASALSLRMRSAGVNGFVRAIRDLA